MGHTTSVRACAIDDSGTHLVSGGKDGVVRCHNVATGEIAWEYKSHTDYINALLIASKSELSILLSILSYINYNNSSNNNIFVDDPVDNTCYSGGLDGTVRGRDASRGKLSTICAHPQSVAFEEVWLFSPMLCFQQI